MANSINANNIHKAYSKQISQMEESFDELKSSIDQSFDDSELKDCVTVANSIIKHNDSSFEQLKTSKIEAIDINHNHKSSIKAKATTETLDDKLKSQPEAEVTDLLGKGNSAESASNP